MHTPPRPAQSLPLHTCTRTHVCTRTRTHARTRAHEQTQTRVHASTHTHPSLPVPGAGFWASLCSARSGRARLGGDFCVSGPAPHIAIGGRMGFAGAQTTRAVHLGVSWMSRNKCTPKAGCSPFTHVSARCGHSWACDGQGRPTPGEERLRIGGGLWGVCCPSPSRCELPRSGLWPRNLPQREGKGA